MRSRLEGLSGERRRLLEKLLRQEELATGRLPIPRAERDGDLPLSHGQLGLWLADQAAPESPAYNMPGILRLRGELSLPALRDALAAIVGRHEALRTRFQVVAGRPVQRVRTPEGPHLPVCDLSALPVRRREPVALGAARAEASRPFDLGTGGPLRVAVLRLAPEHHLLVLTAHHIVADRWAMAVVLRELATLYGAARRGDPDPLSEPSLQQGDVTVWQRWRAESGELDGEMEHWRRVLASPPTPLELPADRPRPARPSGAGDRWSSPLGLDADRLQGLAEECRTTPFNLLLAAYAALLARLTGRRRLVVGTPVAGRQRKETRELVGLLVNTVPIRLELAGDPTFRELVQRVTSASRDALSHQDLPFHRLVEELRPERDPRYHPFFQVLFSYQDVELPLDGFGDLDAELIPLHTGTAQLDLTLVARRTDEGGLAADWEYSSDLFDGDRIAGYAAAYETLLTAAAEAPGTPISALPVVGEPERRRLLEEWNPHRRAGEPTPAAGFVDLAVAAVARRAASAVAVEMGDRSLTYGELDAAANRLARRLVARGARPEVRMGLCVGRSPELVAALLGAFRSGAAVVPLDPDYPRDRLAFMARDAGVRLTVCDATGEAALPEGGGEVVRLDGAAPAAADDPGPPPVERDPRNLAYVIYTSGSTGRPKGVAVCHGTAAEHFAAWRRRWSLGPDDRVLAFASLSFDAALEQILPTLSAGSRLVLRAPEVPTPEALAERAEREGWTVLYLPAAYWRALTEVWARGEIGPGALRLVNPGGDVMAPEAVRRLARSPLAGVPLVNGYGPTETVVTTSVHEVPVEHWAGAGGPARVPVGTPFSGRTVYVLDRSLRLLPPGVPGELCVGGPFLARGYLGRPARTAAAFVPDPHSRSPGGRLYRTGDLARHLADGSLDFLGRVDHQVKVRGFRIELGEVEAAVEELPAVERVVAAAPETSPGERRLVAYVVPARTAADGDLDPAALRRALRDRLPEHMMPGAWVRLDELPLLPNGKVDRGSLPAPRQPEADRSAETVPPGDPREALLAALWEEVLGVERVGVQDNFFTLGGDSILSLQIIARAHEGGLRLTPSQFFRYPTVGELAAVAETTAASAVRHRAAVGTVPPTPIQRWFFEQGFAEPDHWNQGQLFSVDRPVEPAHFLRAAAHLFDHHDALRSRFDRQESGWVQEIREPDGRAPAAVVDLRAVPPSRRAEARRRAAPALQASLDLRSGPVGRMVLLRGGGEAGRDEDGADELLMIFHHLVIDGVSWRVLLEDLGAALAALADGRTPEVPPRTTSVIAWGEALATLARDGRFLDELDHWLAASPRRRSGEPGRVADARRHVVSLDGETTERLLREAPRAYRTQVNDLLLTALAQSTAAVGEGTTLSVELEGHGREEVEEGIDLSRTVGFLTSKFPVRLDLGDLDDVDDPGAALTLVKETLRRVPNRGLGYGVLRHLDERPESRELALAPRPALTFNYLGRLDAADGLAWPLRARFGAAGPEVGGRNRRPVALEVIGFVLDGRLSLVWDHDPALRPPELVDAWAEACTGRLRRLVEHCASRDGVHFTPSDFPLAALDAAGLEVVRAAVPELEDAYPMSPVQEGMLYHSLSEPRSGVYVEQLVVELVGDLDAAAFEAAWRRVVERHPVLRTAFVWEGLERPVQAVARRVELPWRTLDWSDLAEAERERRLAGVLSDDRERGFEVGAAPLMRLFLIREGPGRHRFLWCNHHLLVDGWTEPMILDEVFAVYAELTAGVPAELAPRRPYRDYIAWLEERDAAAAERFWRGALAGLESPTLIPPDPASRADAVGHREEELRLAPDLSAALDALCRRAGLTVNTLVQGAWLLLLGVYTGRRDVVTGITVSGRPPDLPGADSMIGMFINTLPLRARLDPEAGVVGWLSRLQEDTGELLGHEATPLVEAQAWSPLPRGVPLFDTIVVCMNLPRDEERLDRPAAGLRVERAYGIEQTNYPLTVTARPGERLLLQINYQLRSFTAERARAVAAHFAALFIALVERPDLSVGSVASVVEESDRRRRAEAAGRQRDRRRRAFAKVRRRSAESGDAAELEEARS